MSASSPAAGPTLWLLRHAPVLAAPGLCYGRTDLPADPAATRRAAETLAKQLPRRTVVKTSPLQRCELLALDLQALRPDLAFKTDARLAEMDFGAWEGQPWGHIPRAAFDAWLADFAAAPPGDPVRSVGVDIPIGLVDGPKRAADVAARSFVGERRSSVFWAPHRSALGFTTQAEANAHLASIGMPLLSAQAMGLMGRIREAASVAAADERVVETFPEASFRHLAGAGLSHAKRTAAGALHRLALLRAAEPPIELPADLGPAGSVPIDDAFDAAACAWSARRLALGLAVALGDPAERDPATGRRIAMWV